MLSLYDIAPHLKNVSIVLASQSPRRRQLLEMIGLRFTTRPPLFEENLDKARYIGRPQEYVLATAEHKARDLAAEPSTSKQLVLACDTVVVADGEIMEKPSDCERAYEMLSKLNNRTHTVYTAIVLATVIGRDYTLKERICVSTDVTFGNNSDVMLKWYADSGRGLDKAGAYGIQDEGATLISGINGSYHTVMGLPIHSLVRLLVDNNYFGQ